MNKETPLFLESLKFRKSRKFTVFCSHPIGASCMLYGRLQGFIPRKPAKFQDHILRLHTVRLVHACLALVWLMSATLRVYTLTSSLVTLCRCVDLRAYSTDWSAFGLPGNYRMRQFQLCVQKGKRRSGRHSNSVSRQKMCQNGHNAFRKAYGNLRGKWEMGQESR
jgi:hypothetical protein